MSTDGLEKPEKTLKREWLWFLLFGPPLGGVVFLFIMNVHKLFDGTSFRGSSLPWEEASYIVYVCLGILMMFYFLGGLPALLTGILATRLRKVKAIIYVLVLGCAGSIFAVVCGFWIADFQDAKLIMMTGAITSVVISIFLRWYTR
ncbi:hypothetical protein HA050_14050 [Iodobacter sp. HSC-16F04]|uniref:Uncharacterized protein n=1 Tax=Iodobacter violaceini TaxID=3044271 RepID=A0ABX0KRG9_9NEIS|nr:hypothetical protein [Iodobacter violacea]NHQ87235.1 hypothetical protein [Iodobacter violacea]